MTRSKISVGLLFAVLFSACGLLTPGSYAQMGPTFSIDWQGPSNFNMPGPFLGVIDGFAIGPIDEGSILTTAIPGPPGPNPPVPAPPLAPGLMVGAAPGAAGSIPGGLGILPSFVNGAVELDALSYGRDVVMPVPDPAVPANSLFFSVDEFAVGLLPGFPPDVASEGVFGTAEASADVFNYLGFYGPLPGGIPPGPWNVDVIDGNGLPPFGGPGTGLVEPNPATPFDFGFTDPGDNLDAVDVNTMLSDFPGPIYFSLDSNFPDPLEVVPGGPPAPNNATAISNGFSGSDVLVGGAGGFPGLFISAVTLGLDLSGTDTDDLDALALMENGDGVGAPGAPGSGAAGLDEILFSVRRGSAVIGAPDSAFGAPIEEGDILTAPCPAGTVLPSGTVCVGGGTPSIFIFAEQLGLATFRAGTGASWGMINPAYGQDQWADDLDALDVVPEPGSLALLLVAMMVFVAGRRRRLT